MTLRQIIEKKKDRLETVPDQFISKVETAQKEIFNEAIKLLDELSRTADGKIELTTANFAKIEKIGDKLQQVLFDREYGEAVVSFAKEFGEQANINKKYFENAFGDFTDKSIFKNIQQNSLKRVLLDLDDAAISREFINPMKEILNASVTNGQTFTDAVKTLRTFIEGNPEVDGTLLSHVKQVAVDGFSIADREYTNIISEDLGAEWFLYSGGKIKTTRPFCEERTGKYFHKKEIEGWGNDEKCCGLEFPTSDGWAGKIPNTNSSTIFSYAGGYFCRHSILPVSIAIVPDDVVTRNLENGNYKE